MKYLLLKTFFFFLTLMKIIIHCNLNLFHFYVTLCRHSFDSNWALKIYFNIISKKQLVILLIKNSFFFYRKIITCF